ncbi:MAG: periplasmic binding protein/LacI transcriptional regulator [Verrucomicrobiales bacterium]|nr:periplasmic binding protein/LacI transcriptional regulator [Verrucomicrobiales bacterium]MDB6129557.1 periplasmic binding protein/LacI transcriptional regulator [Verrucomicrobiales bacterium]
MKIDLLSLTTGVRRQSSQILAALLLFCISGCNKEASTAGSGTNSPAQGTISGKSIAVIPKGSTHSHWKSVEAGAKKAGAELGYEILWKAPLKENDRAQQIAIVEQFVSEGVAGIVLAPLDDVALLRPVKGAVSKGIPVLLFDSGLKGEQGKDFISYVGTDNKLGGKLGGEELARLLNGKGKVVLLKYSEGSASTAEREAGFLEAIKQHPGIQLIVDNRYGGVTASEAQATALNMLDQLREADGIFCSNESLTMGMLLALRQNNLTGKAKFVGFDASAQLVEALRKGEIQALVAQNPKKMGYEGVKAMVRHIKGEKLPAVIDSGVQLITPENIESEAVKELFK